MDKVVFLFCVALFVWCYGDAVVIQCGQNQEVRCVDGHPEKTCDDYDIYDDYCQDDIKKCRPKCVCKEGYYRNYLNECISEANCAKCSKPNEFFTCGPECDNECKNLSDNRITCSIRNVVCNPKCYCKDGYARDNKNVCVPISQCSYKLVCSRPNEESVCVFKCPPEKTCDTRNVFYKCARNESEVCQYKCRCKEGYYRNYLNECISEANCEKCSKPNEFFTCGPECDNECKDLSDNRANCSIQNIVCNPKCYCKDGYARNNNRDCIPDSQCSSNLKCNRLNEVKTCVFKCPPERTCDNRFIQFNCFRNETEVCEDKCVCKAGYYRNYLNECITKENCEKCSGDNEFYSCGTECDNKCNNLKYNRTHCNVVNKKCNNKCYCKDGYERDACDKCIPVEDCNKPVCNQPNEESVCVFECPPEKTCDTRDIFYDCARNEAEVCQDQCRCKEGYYRNYLNECISEDNCDKPVCNQPNEESVCVFECPPEKTCDTRNVFYRCAINESEVCQYKCRCKEGYYRNYLNECISEDNCAKCTKDNEFFTCGPECDNRCASLDTSNRTKCDIENIQCNEKCYCEDGYARDEFGNCIPVKQCNESCKGPHEVYMKCKRTCPPDTCISLLALYNCSNVTCQTDGCICQDNFKRQTPKSRCIPTEQCHDRCEGPHEVYYSKCKITCPPDTCAALVIRIDCNRVNNSTKCEPGCICQENYKRPSSNGTCMPIDQCFK